MTTLKDLSALQDEIIDGRRELDAEKKRVDALAAALEAKKRKMVEFMLEAKLTNFKTARGQIILNRKFAVTVPKGDQLAEFFGYLEKERPADFKALATVNYQTLNSWFMTELENARERGDLDFKVPGLAEPTASEYLSIKES